MGYKGSKPTWLPVCDGVCDGYKKNRCPECVKAYRKHSAGGHASRGPANEGAFSLVEIVRANPHLDWSEIQLKKAGVR